MKSKKWIIYHKVQSYSRDGYGPTYISRQLDISRATVYKYLKMSEYEFLEFLDSLETRARVLDGVRDYINELIQQKMKPPKIKTILKMEKNIDVSIQTVRNYINETLN